jgi:hypothetical protein
MIGKIRSMVLGLNVQGSRMEEATEVRKFGLGIASLARKPAEMAAQVRNLIDAEQRHHQETLSWLKPAEIKAGKSGRFEACSLLAWLEIAEKAGVKAVPAKVILHLTDAESEVLSGNIPLDNPMGHAITGRFRKAIEDQKESLADLLAQEPAQEEPVDMEILVEKIYACMDEVPEGWMVRSNQCGASSLKALAGTGLAGPEAPEVRFGADLEIGPGWVRNGNRRRVDVSDRRILKSYVQGPHTGLVFVARPWVESSRYTVGRDPHREGTPFASEGMWPGEWRAFVVNGKVVGVSNYYGWVETATPETAKVVLEVRELAQKMVDAAIAQGLEPRFADMENARLNPALAGILDETGYHEGSFSCTLDFIETSEGILLLEGGPGASPVGGGHPCAFAGTSGSPRIGVPMDVEGVAFRHMPHVNIADPSTWEDGDRTGCILSWSEVSELAQA